MVAVLVCDEYRIYVRKGKAQLLQGFFGTSRADAAVDENFCVFGFGKKQFPVDEEKRVYAFKTKILSL